LHTFVVTSLRCMSGYSKVSVSELKKKGRILFIGRWCYVALPKNVMPSAVHLIGCVLFSVARSSVLQFNWGCDCVLISGWAEPATSPHSHYLNDSVV